MRLRTPSPQRKMTTMLKTIAIVLATTVTALAPLSAADKPPLRIGTTSVYTFEQQREQPFAACLAAEGFSPTTPLRERKTWSTSRQQHYTETYWSCFHRFLEATPDRVEHDTYCWIDGLRPREECAQP